MARLYWHSMVAVKGDPMLTCVNTNVCCAAKCNIAFTIFSLNRRCLITSQDEVIAVN